MALLGGVGACGEGGGGTPTPVEPTPEPVATVLLSPAADLSLETGQSRTLEATLRDQAGRTLSGRNVVWQSTAPTIAAITAGGTGTVATLTAVSLGSALVTATSEGRSASITVTVSLPPEFDASIVDAQWTQAAQSADGSIPMVLGGNAAVLNVLMESTRSTSSVGLLVLSLRDETDAIVHADTLDPGVLDRSGSWTLPSAQFLVPATVLREGLRWRLQRDPGALTADSDAANDVFPRDASEPLRVVSLPTMRLRFVPLMLAAHAGASGAVTQANLEDYLPKFRRIFPMGALETVVSPAIVTDAVFGSPPDGGASGFWSQVLAELDMARVAAGGDDEYWMGVVRPPSGFTYTAFGGYGYIPSNPRSSGPATRTATVVQTGWFSNTEQTADLVVHETAHMLGRLHAPCGGAGGPDPEFPVGDGRIGAVGHDVFGWSAGLATRAASIAATTGDVMGYCFPQWAGPYTYRAMLEARRPAIATNAIERTAASSALRSPLRSPQRERVVVVRGRVERGELSLLPTVSIDGFATAEQLGSVTVQLRDAQGQVIATRGAALRELDHGDARTFIVAIPLDDVNAARLASVSVTAANGQTVRQQRARRAASPIVARVDATAAAFRPGGATVRCGDPASTAMVVQDAATGRLMASVTGASVSLPFVGATRLLVSCSDGVHSDRAEIAFRSALMPALPGR